MNKNLSDYSLFELLDIKELLDKSSFTVNEIFDTIAKKLINEYQISKNGVTYEFLEFEFYYYDKTHKDVITYERTIEKGKWFFHNSGMDLAFKSNKNYYGGILIRSLLKGGQEIIVGPLKSSWELFDSFNAFTPSLEEYPIITKKAENSKFDIYKTTRHIPYKKENIEKKYKQDSDNFIKFLTSPYRYYIIKHPKWAEIKTSVYNACPWDRGNDEVLL